VKKIKVYSHATFLTGENSITLEQTELLEKTGLFDASEVNMMLHYEEEPFDWLKERWSDKSNVKYKVFDKSYKEWYEYTSCLEIQKDCEQAEEEFYLLYIHHKGSFTRTLGNIYWRHYMQYFNIEKWRECVAKLDEGYDMCGAAWPKEINEGDMPYYPGNFFWAKSSYINRCTKLKVPTENNFQPQFPKQPHLRFDLEIWHGTGKPKAFDMDPNSFDRCWYQPASSYRNNNS
jgi:hypothetical protein